MISILLSKHDSHTEYPTIVPSADLRTPLLMSVRHSKTKTAYGRNVEMKIKFVLRKYNNAH